MKVIYYVHAFENFSVSFRYTESDCFIYIYICIYTYTFFSIIGKILNIRY